MRSNTTTREGDKHLTTQHQRDTENAVPERSRRHRCARFYDAEVGRFLSVDPLAVKRLSLNPYNYCSQNHVLRTDPTGALDHPIFDTSGELLGTDEFGLSGSAIIMNDEDFCQGMTYQEAKEKDLGYCGLVGDEAEICFNENYAALQRRPDFDGYLTKQEADSWWLNKSGEPLFVDVSKLELGTTFTSEFGDDSKITKNLVTTMTNTGDVFGTLTFNLVNKNTGEMNIGVNIVGHEYLDKYNYNYDGRLLRDVFVWLGKPSGEGA